MKSKSYKFDADVALGDKIFKAVCEMMTSNNGKITMILRRKDNDEMISSVGFDKKILCGR